MTQETHTEITPSLPVLLYAAQDLIQKGWELNPDIPPSNIGFSYCAHFVRNTAPEPAQVDGELVIDEPEQEVVVESKPKSPGRPKKVQ